MSLDHIKEFLQKMQADQDLKNEVLSASTADDVARIAMRLGYEFSGDEVAKIFRAESWPSHG